MFLTFFLPIFTKFFLKMAKKKAAVLAGGGCVKEVSDKII